MILSQEYKKKHYFFLSRKLVVCFLISITLNNTYAQVQRGKKDDAKAELISFKDRWGIKTNAVDWLLTVPNIGVEFDLGNTIRNKRTIGAKYKVELEHLAKVHPIPYFQCIRCTGRVASVFSHP